MRISTLKLGYAVKVGPREEQFMRDDIYDMHFVNEKVIKLTDIKSGLTSFTHIGNVVYWTMDENQALNKKAKGKD